jgi:hypothetical protein
MVTGVAGISDAADVVVGVLRCVVVVDGTVGGRALSNPLGYTVYHRTYLLTSPGFYSYDD